MEELEQRVASAKQDEERKELDKELTTKRVKRDLADARTVCDYVDTCVQLLMFRDDKVTSIHLCTSAS